MRKSASPVLHFHRGRRGAGLLDRTQFMRPIAHRGLHSKAGGRIENTAPAFLAAIEKGYGIECDLQAAADGTPMVFHDDKLDRLLGAPGRISRLAPAALARLRYRNSDTPILTFTDFLRLVDGRAPLLVEVKVNPATPREVFLDRIARQARAYEGPIALMSFDGAVVSALAKLAPTVPRGPVIGAHQLPARWWATPAAAGPVTMARMLGRVPAGSGFLAVEVRILRGTREWMTRNGIDLPLFSWTIRSRRERATAARFADAPIFEGYEP
ncbi:MAG TPA: glycerophosphodiester phosphodiesterase family protein [Hyphomicrobiaceae bacterium]|nr:glycerophosphodiester phosphodiesterase family protein [Hyphomicrobiaceae bacterium]